MCRERGERGYSSTVSKVSAVCSDSFEVVVAAGLMLSR